MQGKKGRYVIACEDGLTLLGIQREVIALTEGSWGYWSFCYHLPNYFKTKYLFEAMGGGKITCSSCITQVRYCFYSQEANIVQIKSSVSWLSLVLLLTVNRHLWRNVMYAVTLLPEGGKFGVKVDFCLIFSSILAFFPNFFFLTSPTQNIFRATIRNGGGNIDF